MRKMVELAAPRVESGCCGPGAADLGEELEDRDGGVLGTACAQVVPVGVDQGGSVDRGADQTLGLGHARVALDGVGREVEAAGAFE